jgi:hypothetical protein
MNASGPGSSVRVTSTVLFCTYQQDGAALVHTEGDPPLDANRRASIHVQGVAPGLVPSATDNDPHLPHARTAQELGGLVACPWHCNIEQSPQFKCMGKKRFLHLSCVYLPMYLQHDELSMLCRDGDGLCDGATWGICETKFQGRELHSTCRYSQILKSDPHSTAFMGHAGVWKF